MKKDYLFVVMMLVMLAFIDRSVFAEDHINGAIQTHSDNIVLSDSTSLSDLSYETAMLSFGFYKSSNPKLEEDVIGVIKGDTITVDFPFYADITNLVATFQIDGDSVLIGDVVQDSQTTKNNFLSPVTYCVLSADSIAKEYAICVTNLDLGLPVVYINTVDYAPIVSKEEYLDAELTIDGGSYYTSLPTTVVEIKGRGNTTWDYPKKPYAIKMHKDTKSEILDMPKHKKWVLLANWMDRTLLRNAVAFRIGEAVQLDWVSRQRPVDVILNGAHVGNYTLCEKIEIDENRVNVEELDSEDITEDVISGGYLLELDSYYDEVNKFRSNINNFPVNIKDPDEDDLVTEQFNYISNFFNDLEAALYAGNFELAFENLDIISFADYWLAHELTGNTEPTTPKSSYMHKDRDGKLKAGPLWDFDWGTFTDKHVSSLPMKYALFYRYLYYNPKFYSLIIDRWSLHRAKLLEVVDFIDSQQALIAPSEAINADMWPLDSRYVNGDEQLSFNEAVLKLKSNYLAKFNYMDKLFYQTTHIGVEDVDISNVLVSGSKGEIKIVSDRAIDVEVYSINGIQQTQMRIDGVGAISIQKGFYIVMADNRAYKIVVE